MGKKQSMRFVLPVEDSWRELCRNLKLSDLRAAALNATLIEAERGCRDLGKNAPLSEIKRSLKVLDRLLSNAHRGLQRSDIQQALATLEMNGAISFLLSRGAGAHIHGNTAPSALDHDRLLNDRTPEVMLYLLDQMRRPIANWLTIAALNKGGNQPTSDRQLLLLLLARDSNEIIGVGPSGTPNGPFHQLCSWVLKSCGISNKGLEDAITRCLKKYKDWLDWAQLPSAEHIVGRLSEAEISAIPDDPEAELT